MPFRIFKQFWNERIMNSYERDKVQYLTSEEKKRYFQEKVRDLRKYDRHGILNHPDWFFRVVVLDFIVNEIQRLTYWFKNCAYDDFDTIYKIMRKLRLLLLDVDAVRSSQKFEINRTNLFFVSDEDAKEFTKIDSLLNGNTLYQLFNGQLRLDFKKYESEQKKKEEVVVPIKDKELIQEQQSEIQTEYQRRVRQDIVQRFWGGEEGLTKAAYYEANMETDKPVGGIDIGIGRPGTLDEGKHIIKNFATLAELKNRIIHLKLTNSADADTDTELRELLGAFANQVALIKEGLVIKKANSMQELADKELT